MGFAGVGASAILLIATVYSGAVVIDTQADIGAKLDRTRQNAAVQQNEALTTTFTISSVTAGAGTVTITLTNYGSTTIDAARLSVLLDNTPTAIDSHTIGGVDSDVWSPGTTIEMVLTGAGPNTVVVATNLGISTTWRA